MYALLKSALSLITSSPHGTNGFSTNRIFIAVNGTANHVMRRFPLVEISQATCKANTLVYSRLRTCKQ